MNNAQPGPALPHPLNDLRGYASKAYLPRPTVSILRHERKRLHRGASTSTASRLLKCGVGPRGGKRLLVGIDTIDLDELNESCKEWFYKSIPRKVDFKTVAAKNLALFQSSIDLTMDDAVSDAGLDPRLVTFTMPAPNFQTVKAEVFENDEAQTLSHASSDNPPTELPDPPHSAASESWSVSTMTHTARVSNVLQQTLLATASSILHLSEPSHVQGWEWLTPAEAWDIAQTRRELPFGGFSENEASDLLRRLSTDALQGWECWIWGKKPTNCFPEGRGIGELGMVVIVQPGWAVSSQTFEDLASPQEFSDGVRGETSFITSDALWAALHDTCRYLGIHHFAISTFTDTSFGCFSENHLTGYVSPPVGDVRGEPSVLVHLMYWMRSGMHTCEYRWAPPVEEVDEEEPMQYEFPSVSRTIKENMAPILLDAGVREFLAQDSYDDDLSKRAFLSTRAAQIAQRIDIAIREEYREAQIDGLVTGRDSGGRPIGAGAVPRQFSLTGWVPPSADVQARLARKRKAAGPPPADVQATGSSKRRRKPFPKSTLAKGKGKEKAVEPASGSVESIPAARPRGHRRTVSLGEPGPNGSGDSSTHRTVVGRRDPSTRVISGETRSITYAPSPRDDPLEGTALPGPSTARCRSRSADAVRSRIPSSPVPQNAPRRSTRVPVIPDRLTIRWS